MTSSGRLTQRRSSAPDYDAGLTKLHVIQGTRPPETQADQVRKRVRRAPKPAALLQCRRCEGREVIETKIGVVLKDGRPTGGTKQLLCAVCLLRGERVVIA